VRHIYVDHVHSGSQAFPARRCLGRPVGSRNTKRRFAVHGQQCRVHRAGWQGASVHGANFTSWSIANARPSTGEISTWDAACRPSISGRRHWMSWPGGYGAACGSCAPLPGVLVNNELAAASRARWQPLASADPPCDSRSLTARERSAWVEAEVSAEA
jgi:hypothetical protein